MSPQQVERRPGKQTPLGAPGPSGGDQSWRWVFLLLMLAVVGILFIPPLLSKPSAKSLDYTTFLSDVKAKGVATATVNNNTGTITGRLRDGTNYTVNGPEPSIPADVKLMQSDGVSLNFTTPSSNAFLSIITYLLPIILIVGVFLWMTRRAQGQMSGIMSIGRSKARLYTTERPRTTFEDVAGYPGVKTEISEVVDFLKYPGRFRDVGARIPKGILLVGPPGTGKTLFARAVAGEAGVPFMSVSGSDFMEMFVGVGASRVRDLFQTARKQAPAIIFID